MLKFDDNMKTKETMLRSLLLLLLWSAATLQGQTYLTMSTPGFMFSEPNVDFNKASQISGRKVEFLELIKDPSGHSVFKVRFGTQVGYVFSGHVAYDDAYYSIVNDYYPYSANIIESDIEQVKTEESILKKDLLAISSELSKEIPVSSSINTDVRASIKENITSNGNKEINLHVEYFYEVVKAQLELKTDDYPAGYYTLSSSNAATLTANFIRKTIETNLKKYITPNRKISIVITGTTDASKVGSQLKYGGEFGEINDRIYFSNGSLQSITIRANESIESNAQLAYLRTEGLRRYLENNIPLLKTVSLNFEQRAEVSEEIGSEFRKIRVEIIIHDAFQKSSEGQNIDLTKLYIQCKNSVFLLYSVGQKSVSQGSGFFINEQGIGVTNYHVLNSSKLKSSYIVLENGQELFIERIIEENQDMDYSIFKVNNSSGIKFSKADISYLNSVVGESVFAIGNPKGLEKTLSEGIISGFRDSEKYIQTTTPITYGSSGGPLFNRRGEVIGITTSGLGEANLNFAINIRKIKLERFK